MSCWPTSSPGRWRTVVMSRWLQNYAYSAGISFAWFIAGGVVALVIAWLTIGAHALAAAGRNPVNALKQN